MVKFKFHRGLNPKRKLIMRIREHFNLRTHPYKTQGLEYQKSLLQHHHNHRNTCQLSRRSIWKALVTLNLFGVLILSVLNWISILPNYRVSPIELSLVTSKLKLGPCKFPKVEPFSEDVQPFIGKPGLAHCAHAANPIGEIIFEVIEGTRMLKQIKPFLSDCCYRPFYRINDQDIQTEDNCYPIKDNLTEIPLEHEFIEVLCISEKEDYRDGFAFVQERPDVEYFVNHVDQPLGRSKVDRLSVIVLGIDATSQVNFIRTMPQSNTFMLQNLSAIVMNGYTKVAENTLPNVVPLLTGLTLQELKERYINNQVHLDNCPFIWKRFSIHGYRTSFAEDDVDISIFNMNWAQAFSKPPTDFYLRPFSMRMQRKQTSEDGLCYGTRLSFKVLLDNIYNTALAFKNRPFFQFTWATKLSHNNVNQLSIGDETLLDTLMKLKHGCHLNNTALILMSDHGSRIDEIRNTPQGKIEDRMPLLYIVLPSWFKEKYPQAGKNIEMNSNRLTTAFDVYETLKDFMDLGKLHFEREPLIGTVIKGVSLLNEISQNRSCFLAGIPMHWCICHDKTRVDVGASEVKDAVKHAIGSMNNLLRGQWACATITLVEITEAWVMKQYGDNNDDSQGDGGNKEKLLVHQVSFKTSPGDGEFEATLIRDQNGAWMLTEQVVRTNSYEGQSHCVHQELKEFCYCKD